jgi:predicted Zn-dependent peptidase
MEKAVLKNGLTVIYEPKKSNSIVIQVLINGGSNQEKKNERGIAHFLEHLLFEGTKKRPTNREISNEIEKIGGEFNAFTTGERTSFYIKVLKKHFAVAVDVLADALQNSLFAEEHIAREKKIILKEIDMVNDEPRFYQWILLQKHLFEKHPCRYPTYGEKKDILNLGRDNIVKFFKKNFSPENMIITIVGDAPHWKKMIEDNFTMKKKWSTAKKINWEKPQKKDKLKVEKKKVANTYMVFGFRTVPKGHDDCYVLDVINAILGRGQSGKMFTEIRSKRGLAYDVGTQQVAETSFGFFAVYVIVEKKNVSLVKRVVLEELEKLKEVSEKDLKEAKDFIEGDYLLGMEDNQRVADELGQWELTGDARMMKTYLQHIKSVKASDIRKAANTYFKHHTLAIIEGSN